MIVNETRIDVLQDHDTDPDLVNYEPVRRKPLWSVFARAWCLRQYPDAERQMGALGIADPEQFYGEYGARLGHSPNMFFDEAWYMRENPDVADFVHAGGFPSGFAHYCHDGFRERSPHWLFSEKFYLASNPDVTRGVLD